MKTDHSMTGIQTIVGQEYRPHRNKDTDLEICLQPPVLFERLDKTIEEEIVVLGRERNDVSRANIEAEIQY